MDQEWSFLMIDSWKHCKRAGTANHWALISIHISGILHKIQEQLRIIIFFTNTLWKGTGVFRLSHKNRHYHLVERPVQFILTNCAFCLRVDCHCLIIVYHKIFEGLVEIREFQSKSLYILCIHVIITKNILRVFQIK